MCELLGISAGKPVDVRNYLKTFYSHSVRHPHGWGLMRASDGAYEIIKEQVCASGSRILSGVVEKTQPQTNMLAHIRLATVGSVKYDNCHPFSGFDASGRRWTFMHNGTIYSAGTKLSKYHEEQVGDTDSERIFLYLMDELNREIILNDAPLNTEQRCRLIDRLTASLSPRNKLNLMIFDGEILYVHKNMRDTLVFRETENGVILSTAPLDSGTWEDLPMTRLFAYKDGKRVYEGAPHGNEFIPTLEYINAMAAMNI